LRNTRIVRDEPVKDLSALESARSNTGFEDTSPDEFIHEAFGIVPYAKRKPTYSSCVDDVTVYTSVRFEILIAEGSLR